MKAFIVRLSNFPKKCHQRPTEFMTTAEKTQKYILPTYGRFPLTIIRGEGTRVWDEQDREYLDFCMGIATCSLGHCHPALTRAICEQAKTLMHCSNLYHIEPQANLAEIIIEKVLKQPGQVFFANSGAEANDGLIKFARKFGNPSGRYEIITFQQSFHGRTLGSMSATAQAKIQEGFDPLLPGFRYVEFNNLEQAKAAITDKTVAFLVEPIQGEGGVNVASREFLEGLSALANENNLLLLLDEVQCGAGRTGHLNGFEAISPTLKPDAISWAKGMGGGFPIGAFWVSEKHTHLLGPGSHGSTYGGNALAAAASKSVFDLILSENLIENVIAREDQIRREITSWNHPAIKEIRGHGLLLGIGLDPVALKNNEGQNPAIALTTFLLSKGLLVVPAGPHTIRLLPPLNVSSADVQKALTLLREGLNEQMCAQNPG
jgi:predicted acetylornithine/succinylornithine family transaminase